MCHLNRYGRANIMVYKFPLLVIYHEVDSRRHQPPKQLIVSDSSLCSELNRFQDIDGDHFVPSVGRFCTFEREAMPV